MFRLNNAKCEQQTLFSTKECWTNYQMKLIQNGWVGYFHDHVFPVIDETSFKVLYSDNAASCPNTPVNILIGLLILKSLLNMSDDEVIQALLFDQRVQYALHTLDDDKQKISKNMLQIFRKKLREYEDKTGINLLEDEMKKLNGVIIEMSNIDKSIERTDSMMISASCKRLSRIELVYITNYMFVKVLKDNNKDIEDHKCYLEEGNKNDTIYRTRDVDSESKLEMLLKHSVSLYNAYKDDEDVNQSDEFLNLKRLIDDQYDSDNKKPKDGKNIKPTSMQTPHDPEATYRYKYKNNVGYVANITEVVDTTSKDKGKNKVLVKDWDIDSNITSDKELLERQIEEKKVKNDTTEVTKIVDGAYYSDELREKAEEVNINLHPTELVGNKGKDTNLAEFKIDDENHQILECPNGNKPISCTYNEKNENITAKFSKEDCANCSHKDQCPFKEQIKVNVVRTNQKAINNAKLREERKSPEYQQISNIRAGVEGLPSLLRRRYHIDIRPARGKFYLKLAFSTSIIAINIKRANKIAQNITIITKILSFWIKFKFTTIIQPTMLSVNY